MTTIIVDGQEIDVPATHTIMQACEEAGAEIPRFCFHERLSIAGNCRMCLVEVVGAPKPVASCAMNVKDLRPGPNGEPPAINTRTALVKKAREGVMEFLLVNHPLDCPICDQGGECDLQDQAMAYGVDNSRFEENKRAVENKNIGPLVKTIMTRCIHCTRCVRFTTEVAGVSDLGATGRGEDMEITTYLEKAMSSELQGNVIDLCPVGALTSRPYAFQARPWELTKTETIDVMDAMGSAIRVDVKGREVMRIMPRLNEAINEEWISDKTRFVWDGLKTQRLDRPFVKREGALRATSWLEAFSAIKEKVAEIKPDKMAALTGSLSAVEDMYALKGLMQGLGVKHYDSRTEGSMLSKKHGRSSYIFNEGFEAIEECDALLIIGSNPRHEAPVLNARILRKVRERQIPVGFIGEAADLTYEYEFLGSGVDALGALSMKGEGAFSQKLKDAKHPLIMIGSEVFSRADAPLIGEYLNALIKQANIVSDDWNGIAILHHNASQVGGLDIDFTPENEGFDTASILKAAEAKKLDLIFLCGQDDIEMSRLGDAFVVYIGSHGDAGAHRADIILPSACYTEKSAIYVNSEGRVQLAQRANFPPGDAREEWAILRALSEMLGCKLPYDSLSELRERLVEEYPHFADIDQRAQSDKAFSFAFADKNCKEDKNPFINIIDNFYLTNPIARASKVMAECSQLHHNINAEAAE